MEKNILITGASRGLGYFLTKKYLEEGDTVFAGARDVTGSLLLELKEQYTERLQIIPLEVTSTESVTKAYQLVGAYTDTIDTIINNAAVHNETSFEPLETADIDDCLGVYDINTLGPLRVIKGFVSFVRNSKQGQVINVSSESGSIGNCWREKEFDYCMSKAALNMGTKLLANYLKKDGVKVIAIHPGWMRTDMGGSNATLDPYETACVLVDLFQKSYDIEGPIFIDNEGNQYPW